MAKTFKDVQQEAFKAGWDAAVERGADLGGGWDHTQEEAFEQFCWDQLPHFEPNVNIDNPAPGHLAQAERALDEMGF